MATKNSKSNFDDPVTEAAFWAECRKRALELNIPAWEIAEQSVLCNTLDVRTRNR